MTSFAKQLLGLSSKSVVILTLAASGAFADQPPATGQQQIEFEAPTVLLRSDGTAALAVVEETPTKLLRSAPDPKEVPTRLLRSGP